MADKSIQKVCLFNCDNTYKLDVVERFLLAVKEKHGFQISVEKFDFRLNQMAELSETIIPQLQMDIAIFVVHAHESRLSINEDNAGIGYAKIYRALLEAAGGKVLIVIGGDNQYRDEDEEERTVISRKARGQVASQFKEEYLDGRKSFIFSWNKQHREIHEEALLHFLDPRKKGQKFEYQPKPKPVLVPQTNETNVIISQPGATDNQKRAVEKDSTEKLIPKDENVARLIPDREEEEQKRSYGAIKPVADYPPGTMLLETHVRYGEISYQKNDVKKREDNWLPSEKDKSDLMRHHKTTPDAKVQFTSQGNGEARMIVLVDTSPPRHTRSKYLCCQQCQK